MTVPFNPGGGADRSARLFAPYLAEALGVPVQVNNVAGGGGWLAWSQMAKWDPDRDDHKLGIVNLPHLFSYMDPRMNRTETLDSFNILAWHSYDPCIWAVREGDERFQTLEELLDHIESNPNAVIISTTGVGSDDHMGIAFAERFLPDFRVRKVFSNNDNKKIQETLSGTTDVVAGNVGYYVPFMLEGRLRPVCVLHDERWAQLPSVKTFHEVTGQKNISYAGRTIAAAPGLPEEKREILLGAIEKAINHPEYVIREINSKNQLMFLKGDALRRKLEESATLAASVRFWEAEE
ncbi:MAG: tripartite tricarboxylate transporter substrate-binding protein [Gammaproteobacteria bacterium]|nr:tripartite tricarboxylate transporter substrate-binding protein [Gammaproteobacteria bacterium]